MAEEEGDLRKTTYAMEDDLRKMTYGRQLLKKYIFLKTVFKLSTWDFAWKSTYRRRPMEDDFLNFFLKNLDDLWKMILKKIVNLRKTTYTMEDDLQKMTFGRQLF